MKTETGKGKDSALANSKRTYNYMYNIEVKKRVNAKRYTPIKIMDTIEEVMAYMNENNLSVKEYPYFFTHITHIKLSDGSIVSHHINGITCSPMKLREALEK